MKFTADARERIEKAFDEKKRENPISAHEIGLGIRIIPCTVTGCVDVYRNGKWMCGIEEVGRMIEELTMLKDAVEEQTGVVL